MKAATDPKKGASKITNTDEQEVVVNHSTEQEGGYDEPVNQQAETNADVVEKNPKQEKSDDAQRERKSPVQKEERKRKYHDEESE